MQTKTLQEKYGEETTKREDAPILEFLDSLKKNKKYKYLEAGAGLGRFPTLLKEKNQNLEIECLEINQDLVDEQKKKGLKSTQGSVLEMPYKDETFDIVQASHIIEHFGYPEITKVLDELFRVLKTNGYLIIRTPLMHPGFYNDIDHVRPYPLKTLIQYFNNTQQQETPKFKTKLIRYWNRNGTLEIESFYKINKLLKFMWLKFNWPKSKPTGYVAIFKKYE